MQIKVRNGVWDKGEYRMCERRKREIPKMKFWMDINACVYSNINVMRLSWLWNFKNVKNLCISNFMTVLKNACIVVASMVYGWLLLKEMGLLYSKMSVRSLNVLIFISKTTNACIKVISNPTFRLKLFVIMDDCKRRRGEGESD